MSNEFTGDITDLENAVSKIINTGDLSQLNEQQRTKYYNGLCEALGLNPLSVPFQYFEFDKRLQLYATKACTEQLRKLYGISIEIRNRDWLCNPGEDVPTMYVVTAVAQDSRGRRDESTGVVSARRRRKNYNTGKFEAVILKDDDLANRMMVAETKAKRRVTLSICGLGMLDETEVESLRDVAENSPQHNREESVEPASSKKIEQLKNILTTKLPESESRNLPEGTGDDMVTQGRTASDSNIETAATGNFITQSDILSMWRNLRDLVPDEEEAKQAMKEILKKHNVKKTTEILSQDLDKVNESIKNYPII